MMFIPCEDPDFVYGDNKSVLSDTIVSASTFKKNMNSLSYQFVREGCSRDEWRTVYVSKNFNFINYWI